LDRLDGGEAAQPGESVMMISTDPEVLRELNEIRVIKRAMIDANNRLRETNANLRRLLAAVIEEHGINVTETQKSIRVSDLTLCRFGFSRDERAMDTILTVINSATYRLENEP
jgi:hypothetical protein